MSAFICVRLRLIMKKSLLIKILFIIALLTLVGCKNVYSKKPSDDTVSRKLQVELRMPEPWKKISIGPMHTIGHPNIRSCGNIETQQSNPVPKEHMVKEKRNKATPSQKNTNP